MSSVFKMGEPNLILNASWKSPAESRGLVLKLLRNMSHSSRMKHIRNTVDPRANCGICVNGSVTLLVHHGTLDAIPVIQVETYDFTTVFGFAYMVENFFGMKGDTVFKGHRALFQRKSSNQNRHPQTAPVFPCERLLVRVDRMRG